MFRIQTIYIAILSFVILFLQPAQGTETIVSAALYSAVPATTGGVWILNQKTGQVRLCNHDIPSPVANGEVREGKPWLDYEKVSEKPLCSEWSD
jgi:hypothetical protein